MGLDGIKEAAAIVAGGDSDALMELSGDITGGSVINAQGMSAGEVAEEVQRITRLAR